MGGQGMEQVLALRPDRAGPCGPGEESGWTRGRALTRRTCQVWSRRSPNSSRGAPGGNHHFVSFILYSPALLQSRALQ